MFEVTFKEKTESEKWISGAQDLSYRKKYLFSFGASASILPEDMEN